MRGLGLAPARRQPVLPVESSFRWCLAEPVVGREEDGLPVIIGLNAYIKR
jgi:hypothetical protein